MLRSIPFVKRLVSVQAEHAFLGPVETCFYFNLLTTVSLVTSRSELLSLLRDKVLYSRLSQGMFAVICVWFIVDGSICIFYVLSKPIQHLHPSSPLLYYLRLLHHSEGGNAIDKRVCVLRNTSSNSLQRASRRLLLLVHAQMNIQVEVNTNSSN